MEFDFDLEVVFAGLCAFGFDNGGATVYFVNATNPGRFAVDPDLSARSCPHPHFPRLSYSMSQQVRKGTPHRDPDQVFSGIGGEETAVCDLDGESLSLEVPGGSSLQAGDLAIAPRLSEVTDATLHGLVSGPLPNPVVVTRLRISAGTLATLHAARVGANDLLVDFRTIESLHSPSDQEPRTIADKLVLRVEHMTGPVVITSDLAQPVKLRPDAKDASGKDMPVRVSFANYHKSYHLPSVAAFDFLWFYELLEFETRPSRRKLRIPYYLNGSKGFTGSSGVCPPIRLQ